MALLDGALAKLEGNEIPGELAFRLYDTYGFPLDLTADIARERELVVDEAGFDAAMEAQRTRARAASQFGSDHSVRIHSDNQTRFVGYTTFATESAVAELYLDGQQVESLSAGQSGALVLAETPFYAESGGQVGDHGVLSANGVELQVTDTQKSGDAIVHTVNVVSGTVQRGQSLQAQVDPSRRGRTQSNHSATHFLHEALQRELGEHVQQKGSLVSPDYLRFDFSHDQPIPGDAIKRIEQRVNAQVRANHEAHIREMPIDEARELGATMLFGEKYGDVVRVVTLGPDSVELCGGTHVARSGEIGSFKITSEGGVASGVRRVEALTGQAAIDYLLEGDQQLNALAGEFNVPRAAVTERVQSMQARVRELERAVDQYKSQLNRVAGQSLVETATEMHGIKVVTSVLEDADSKSLRDNIDQLKNKLGEGVVVLATVEDGTPRVAAGVTKALSQRVSAGDLVRFVAGRIGGKGGGRPEFAQGGGVDASALPDALEAVLHEIDSALNSH